MMAGPISVVVPLFSDSRTYVNRLPLQRRQWISLRNQTDPNFELIGVDNQSHDDVGGLFREYFPSQVYIRHELPNNRPGVRLAGSLKAKNHWVVTLDSECVVFPHYIENWKRFIAEHQEAVGTGGCAAYVGPILSGREFILGTPGNEKLDYVEFEKFARGLGIQSIAGHFVPPSFADADVKGIIAWPHNWAIGFSYANAAFPRKVLIDAATPDAHMCGYGYEDKLIGLRLQHAGITAFDVAGVPYIHQCHRHINERSGIEDCANMGKNFKVVQEVTDQLFPKKK